MSETVAWWIVGAVKDDENWRTLDPDLELFEMEGRNRDKCEALCCWTNQRFCPLHWDYYSKCAVSPRCCEYDMIFLSFYQSIILAICLSIHPLLYLLLYLSVCLSIQPSYIYHSLYCSISFDDHYVFPLMFRWIQTHICLLARPYAEARGLKTCHAGVGIALFSSSPLILLLSPA